MIVDFGSGILLIVISASIKMTLRLFYNDTKKPVVTGKKVILFFYLSLVVSFYRIRKYPSQPKIQAQPN